MMKTLAFLAAMLWAGMAHANLVASTQLPVPVAIAPTSLSVTSAVGAGGTLAAINVTTQPPSTFNGSLAINDSSGLFGLSGYNLTATTGLTTANNGTYTPTVTATENGVSLPQMITVTVNIQQQQQGCPSDSACPTPPAGFHWVMDVNSDFTQGGLPPGWRQPADTTSALSGYNTIQRCHLNGNSLVSFDANGMRVLVPLWLPIDPVTGGGGNCVIDTVGQGHVYGPGFFEFDAAYDLSADYATWMVSLQDNNCQPSSAGWEIDMPEAGTTSTFYSGYQSCSHQVNVFCSGCWQAFPTFQLSGDWWVANGQNIMYYNGVEYGRFTYPNGAGDLNSIPPGQDVIIANGQFPDPGSCFNDGCSGGLYIKRFRHFILAPN